MIDPTSAAYAVDAMPQSRSGQLLIASAHLRDPNFAKAVVLLVKDGEEGAMGVILNRPLQITVADALADKVEAASAVDDLLHQGGPCEGPLSALHINFAAGGDELVDGIRFSMDRESIEWLMTHNEGPIKYIAGYSGWSSGQLDAEIDEGSWLLVPATQQHLFDRQGDWSKLTTWLALGKKIDIARIPDDPSVN